MAEVVAVPPMVVPLPVRRWRADDFQDERRNHQSVWIPFRGRTRGRVFKRADSSPAQTTFPASLISFYDTTLTSRERQRADANLLSPDTQTLL